MIQFRQRRAHHLFIVGSAGGIVQDFRDVGDRPLAVRQLPHQRRGVIETMRRLRLLVVDHQLLADLLGNELVFS